VIENGYDEDAFTGLRTQPEPGKTVILHSGLIYPAHRNPASFFGAVKQLLDAGRLDRSRLVLRFRAPGHADEVKAIAEQHGLSDVLDIGSAVPYREALAEMLSADLLVVIQGTHFNTQIPAKIYEYLRAGRPVLGVVDPAGDTAAFIRPFEGALIGDIEDADSIAKAMDRWIEAAGAAGQPLHYPSHVQAVQAYSRRAQTVRFAQLLEEAASLPES
jgi:glycosyltransferase involved in cell wall biosynthesis